MKGDLNATGDSLIMIVDQMIILTFRGWLLIEQYAVFK